MNHIRLYRFGLKSSRYNLLTELMSNLQFEMLENNLLCVFSASHREEKVLVGLTNNPPSTMPPTNYSYTTCGQWPGSAPASATMFVRCVDNLPPARYVVIIQQYQPRGYLQICELEVYGKCKPLSSMAYR